NVDLKAFTEGFYRRVCGGDLEAVLDTLRYLRRETEVWLEITTLLIPGENDSDEEIHELTRWVASELGCEVPLHFTAFHPDWKMRDIPPTPPATLIRAREIALRNGIHHVYTGNVHDKSGQSTYCPSCGGLVIGRDWYQLSDWHLDPDGQCTHCGHAIAGVFDPQPGDWGPRRQPVRLSVGR
ncbi:MAG: AmmeMemoRadiSam system radical SAM enzyme, partial [Gammaproteobacteria bacterium]|nr:AmmeMemoRadiSam system radical SAM enzyme [Gammaproteobacteria bacterium]